MNAFRRARAALLRLIGLGTREADDARMSEEMRFHLDHLAERYMEEGFSADEARRRAAIEFGGRSGHEEAARDQSRSRLIDDMLRDMRYALRSIRRNPGVALVTILTLALGVGANTAIFSVVYAVLLKPLPYAKPEQLVNVFMTMPKEGIAGTGWSYPSFRFVREQNRVFSEMAGSQHHQLTLTGHGEPAVVTTSVVTPELFPLFGADPLRGRAFRPEDGQPGAPPVVLLSENLWRGVFGGDPNVVGRPVTLDQRSFTVVGIMPSAFRFPAVTEPDQIWVPMAQDPLFGGWMERQGGHWLQVTGRLKQGVSVQQARADMAVVGARLANQGSPDNKGWGIGMLPLRDLFVFDIRSALFVLLGAVGLVLVIACVNITSLLLARAVARGREMAVRTALGAGRARIVRQLLSEAVVLGLIGGATGILVAQWGVQALTALLPPTLPQINAIRVDYVVLAFALLLSGGASVAFGLAPAVLMAGTNPQAGLREGGARAGETATARRVRRMLAVGEVALAMVLLVAAGLFLKSFTRLTATNPGFDVDRIVKAEISLPRFQYSTPQQWAAFSDQLLPRLQAEPGMQQTALAVPIPVANGYVNFSFRIIGAAQSGRTDTHSADYVSVSPGYFGVMGIPLVSGRVFDSHDVMSTSRVTVISRTFAKTYFPNDNPIGKQLVFSFPPTEAFAHEIVGVVGDIRDVSLGNDPLPMMYVPFAQEPLWGAGVVVNSSLGTTTVANAIRRTVAQIDKDLPVSDVAAMPDVLNASVAQPRFRTWLIGLFAAMALALAATGLFGVISYSVSCRTREIGIRVALGASRGSIRTMVLGEAVTLTIAGLVVGIPAALAGSYLIRALLFNVSPGDPLTIALVALALVAVAAIAAYVPVRRALAVDPVTALRAE